MYSEIEIVQLDIANPLTSQIFREVTFDVVTAFDVLFHIVDDDAYQHALSNISCLLEPGGYFIFSENCLHTKALRSIHQVSRPIQEISNMLKGAGFRLVKRVPMFVLMNTPVDTSSVVPVLLWRVIMAPVRMINLLGYIYGAVLFPLELFLVHRLKESPSTEMIICQKVG